MTTYYIDPNGDNTNSGTSTGDPLKNLKAFESEVSLSAGDVVKMRGGTYNYASSADLSSTLGTSSSRIVFEEYQSESPVHDFTGASQGIIFDYSQYVTFSGAEVRNPDKNCFRIFGNESGNSGPQNAVDVVVADCDVHGHGQGGSNGNGFIIAYGADGITIRNCEVYDGYAGGNSDGVNCGVDARNTLIEDSEFHNNPDDGIDLFAGDAHDPNNPATMRNVVCRSNGSNIDGSSTGNGVGFKFGDLNNPAGGHYMERCVAYNNADRGIGNPAIDVAMTVYNCAGVDNGGTNVYFSEDGVSHELTNVTSQEGAGFDLNLGDSVNDTTCNWDESNTGTFNSTDGNGFNSTYQSRDPSNSNFLLPVEGDPAIDAGTDVGLSFNGSAPDIGAYETGTSGSFSSASLKWYDGNSFVAPGNVKSHDGSSFVANSVKVYNGSSWVTAYQVITDTGSLITAAPTTLTASETTSTPATTIDGFNDGTIDSAWSGNTASFTEDSTSPVYEGSGSLKYSTNSYNHLVSTSGFGSYPSQGDIIKYEVNMNVGGSGASTDHLVVFGVQSTSWTPNSYGVRLDGDSGAVDIEKDFSPLSTTSFDFATYGNEQLTVEIDWQTTISVTIYDSQGSQIHTDSWTSGDAYTSGGVGIEQNHRDGNQTVTDHLRFE